MSHHLAIRNIRIKELLLILARLNVAYDTIDIVSTPETGVMIIPTQEASRPVPLTEEERKQVDSKKNRIDPNTSLRDLLG